MHDEPIVLPPSAGRAYAIGPMRGAFKAGGAETEALQPDGAGPDFRNDGTEPATAFNVFIPGGDFERQSASWADAP